MVFIFKRAEKYGRYKLNLEVFHQEWIQQIKNKIEIIQFKNTVNY